jgi:hypothetical protein
MDFRVLAENFVHRDGSNTFQTIWMIQPNTSDYIVLCIWLLWSVIDQTFLQLQRNKYGQLNVAFEIVNLVKLFLIGHLRHVWRRL